MRFIGRCASRKLDARHVEQCGGLRAARSGEEVDGRELLEPSLERAQAA